MFRLASSLVFLAYFGLAADVSGGHLNPAVTTGLFASNKLSGKFDHWLQFMFVQIAGAWLACVLMSHMLPAAEVVTHHYAMFGTMTETNLWKVRHGLSLWRLPAEHGLDP